MALFEQRLIPAWILFLEIQRRGAATTKELKTHFGVDSSSIRRSLAPLLAADAVWCVAMGHGYLFYMVNTGERGKPNPSRARADARKGILHQPGHVLDFKQEMMKQVIVQNQINWGRDRAVIEPQPVAPESNGKKVYSFDDDPEAVELE